MTATVESCGEVDRLRLYLEEMRGQHVHTYDPAQFCLLESLLARASTSEAGIRSGLLAKVESGLQRLAADFLSTRNVCADRLAQLEKLEPELTAAARVLYEQGEYRHALREIARQHNPLPAACVTDATAPAGENELQLQPAASLAEAIQQQQQELFPRGHSDELRSAQRVREVLLKQNAGSLIQQARQKAPSESGPLNPQHLALHSLVTMGELSPQYLQRFVSYIDTLSWLEEAGR
jgi:hypothetical protein